MVSSVPRLSLAVGLTNGIAVAIAAGQHHDLAIKQDRTVVAWGNNNVGQCVVPKQATNIVRIAAGDIFSMALKDNGTVIEWGSVPLDFPSGLTNVVEIAAGNYHSLALRSDGTVVGWGGTQATPPPGLSNVIAISACGNRSVALKNDGSLVAWGGNAGTPPAGLTNVVAIAAGGAHTMVLLGDLRITSISLKAESPAINFHTFSGQRYSVEYSSSMLPEDWTPLPNGLVDGTGRDTSLIDATGIQSLPVRFYRLKLVP